MPLSIRQIVWSLLTEGAKISLIVNGRRSPSFARRQGFPQGSPLSPLLFNLYINSLLVLLNSLDPDIEAWAYADDLAAGAQNRAGIEILIEAAEKWAEEWGMCFNPKKCVLMARSDLYKGQVKGHVLGGEELAVVSETRYLGIERNGQGLMLKAYLDRKINAMDRLLGGLQAAGGHWSPMTRLTIYRSFCRSLLEYGAPLLYPYLMGTPRKPRHQYLLGWKNRHARAVTWIVGIGNSAGKDRLASAMTGLVPPMVRLEHLALGLACFLQGAPPTNPTRILFLKEKENTSRRRAKYLFRLSHLALHDAFVRINRQRLDNHELPFTRSTFLRHHSVAHFSGGSGKLASYIDSSNRPNGLVDGVLLISSDSRRRLAIRWRANTFLYPLLCFVCGETFTRHCTSHALERLPLVDMHGLVEKETRLKVVKAVEVVNRRRTELRFANFESQIRIIDFLVGHKEAAYREIARCTLERWETEMRSLANMVPYHVILFDD
ncbi:uncharacterized protein JCM6883_005936 [Sporobolomyces salmoneus]|uniref:uncharacterized protein n=1 Tax=Sporobolomyces salmoneus TaxID=183962 RepID=UPI00316CDEBB